MTRIVAFIPYAARMTEDEAAQLRAYGEATIVLCDGVFSDCDLHRPPRPANACLLCQAETAGRLATWRMPYRWLSRWLEPEDFARAAQWVGGLRTYPDASYGSWKLGAWIAAHREAQASYLNSALLAALALDRLYDERKPEAVFVCVGEDAVTRAATELATARGIRVLTPAWTGS